MVTKTKIKNLSANKLRRNKAEIVELIQENAETYNKGSDDSKFVIVALFYTLGLSVAESWDAFEKIQERP